MRVVEVVSRLTILKMVDTILDPSFWFVFLFSARIVGMASPIIFSKSSRLSPCPPSLIIYIKDTKVFVYKSIIKLHEEDPY